MNPTIHRVPVPTFLVRGLLVAALPLVIGTCRIGDLISPPTPGLLVVSPVVPDSLPASAARGSTAPRLMPIEIRNTGQGALEWEARVQGNSPWLSLDKTTGPTPDTLWVRMDPTGLDVNTYRDTVVVSATSATGVAQQTPIKFQINPCTEIAILVNDSLGDTITSADCGAPHRTDSYAKIYSFNGTKDDSLSIYVAAPGFDGYVFLDTSLASTSPPLAQSDNCLGATGDPCIIYQRLPATRPYWVEVTTASPGETGEFTLQVPLPRDPNPPASLLQVDDTGATVPPGDTISETTITLTALVSDRDLGDSLHLEAEVKPNTQGLSGSPTGPGGPVVANGERAAVTVTVADNQSYHWQVRAVDNTGNQSGWVAFGNSPDFTVDIPQNPDNPSGPGQFKPNLQSIIVGGTADTDVVVLAATVTDPDPGDQVLLAVEVRPVGTGFSDVATDSSPLGPEGPAQVTVGPLGNNACYHWQFRASDQTGRTSSWIRYGANPEPNGIDFCIALPNVPLAPSGLLQFQNDGTTPLAVGGVTSTQSVVLKGTVSDPDGQQVQLEVELRSITDSFTNTPNYPSPFVASGSQATVSIGGLSPNTDYHWQARAKDNTGRAGGFSSFPQSTPNPETEADFRVQQPPVQLVFSVQPLTATAGTAIAPPIEVTAQDINGNTATAFNGNITLTIENNAGSGTLSGTTTVAASNGVATFDNISINKSGNGYTLRATAPSLGFFKVSNPFNINPGPTTQLVFTTPPPASTQAGVAMNPAVVVTAEDAFLNPTPSFTGSVQLFIVDNPGNPPGTLGNGGPINASGGVATFSNLSINKSGVGYTIRATSTGLTPDTSQGFTITPGPATHLVFTVQPSNAAAGGTITPAVQVTGRDANENNATSFTGNVTVAIGANPGNGNLGGTPTVAATAGTATFSNLSIDNIGDNYTLTASSAGLTGTTSAFFNIVNSPVSPTLSTVTASPATITACSTSCSVPSTASTVTVTARDNSNNPVAGVSATLTVTGIATISPPGAVITNGSGVATWILTSDTVGAKGISATIASITIVDTATVNVNPATATQLVFTNQPTTTTAGLAINGGSGGVVVTARDQFGNTATSFGANVSMAIVAGPGGTFAPTSTNTVPASAGVAQFTNLRIYTAGSGYQIQASGGGLPAVTSNPTFSINTAPVSRLAFVTQPSTTADSAPITPAVRVAGQDSVGNNVTTFTGQVRMFIGDSGTNPGHGALSGTTVVNAVNGTGIATFSNLRINARGTGYTLLTTSSGLTDAISDPFDIIAGPASALFFTVQPSLTVAGAPIFPAVQVTARDNQGNTATSYSGNVTLTIGTNPPGNGILTGGGPLAATAGVVSFPNASIDKAGSGYTLNASATGLTGAGSNSFNIISGGASASQSTVSATSPITACSTSCTTGAGTASLITVTARDALNNPIQGATVTLSATGTFNNITQPVGVTGSNGQITGTLSSQLSESKTVSASIIVGANPPVTPTQMPVVQVNPAAASVLLFTIGPNNTVATQPIRPATGIQVEVRDQFNNRVTTATNLVDLSILNNPANPPGTLSGDASNNAVGGLATFTGLSIDKVGTGYTLLATSPGLTPDTSAQTGFNITVGAATKLGFLQQPTTTAGGATIMPAITVEVQDAGGNRVTSSSASVTLAIATNPGGGSLSGDSVNNAVSGVATFNTLSINNAGTGYTLQATATGLTAATSASFDITVGGAARLAFVQPPTTATGGATISPAVTVEIQDAGGNKVPGATNSVTLTIGTNPGPNAVLSGTNPVNAVNGTATFSNLSIDSAGTGYTLVATSGALTQATSSPFDINVGAASKLGFRVQPSTTTGGVAFSPNVQVEVQDAGGNRVTSASNSITLDIGVNQGPNAVLSGTNPVSASSGVATFAGMSIDSAGSGYTLVATTGGLTQATSVPFTVNVGPAAKLAFRGPPSNAVAGVNIAPAIQIEIQDLGGNRVTGPNHSVLIAILNNAGNPPGTLSGGPNPRNSSGGLVSFSNLSIDKSGSGYTLQATSSGLTSATSTAFNITHAGADHLVFTVQPSSTAQNQPITPAVEVEIRDAFENLVDNATDNIAIVIGTNPGVPSPGTLAGTTTVAAVAGVATFNDLSIDNLGIGYTLVVSSGSLIGATSDPFDITL